jgi:hypothetical protein
MKRRHDLRKIKGKRCYSVKQLAALLNVHRNTIRGWLRDDGLAVALIDQTHPFMMHGVATKKWLKERQDKRRWTCAKNEMSCFSCKGPRQIKPDSFRILPSNTQKIIAQGDCMKCGRRLNRFDIAANKDKLISQFKANG